MLTALLLSYLFGGGVDMSGSVLTKAFLDDTSQQIRIIVEDPRRRREALDLIDELEDELEAFDKRFDKTQGPLGEAYRDHDSGPAAMHTQLAALESRWEISQSRSVELHFRLRETLTREEWVLLFGPNSMTAR